MVGLSNMPLQTGHAYRVSVADEHISGSVQLIGSKLHSDVSTSCASILTRNELASIEIEIVPSQVFDLKLEGTGRHVFILEPTSIESIAAGLIINECRAGDGSVEKSSLGPGLTVWLTGLSGAGKTTIALQLERSLRPHCVVEALDADIVRTHLCKGLGFTKPDRDENVRRLGFVARLLSDAGIVVLVSAISPYRAAREEMQKSIGNFLEVYINAPVSVCEQRDVKGLYKKARVGEIRFFSGVDDPYEPPLAPDVECRTDRESIDESVAKVLMAIEHKLLVISTNSSNQDCRSNQGVFVDS